MRDIREVRAAYEVLGAIVSEGLPMADTDSQAAICSALDVLCWVLQYQTGENFANNLKSLAEWYAEVSAQEAAGAPN
jgi:hypothetical protein